MDVQNLIKNAPDENTILQILTDANVLQSLNFFEISDIIQELSDNVKQQLLHNEFFIKNCDEFKLSEIILSLNDESITSVLMDNFDLFINILPDLTISNLAEKSSNDELKKMILESCDRLVSSNKEDIIKSFKNSTDKIDALLKYRISYPSINKVLASLDFETLNNFFAEHKDFITKHNILSYEVISKLDISEQKKFVELIEHVNLQEKEKMFCLAVLNPDVKNSVDTTNLSEKYKAALNFEVAEIYFNKYIKYDFNVNPEYYRGLDDYLSTSIYPENFTTEQRAKFFELCDVCPNICIYNDLSDIGKKDASYYLSTAAEYRAAEEWINSLIDSIDPEYSQAQKLAIIDNAIGRKISYSPDFETEVFSDDDCRALWKIIDSGYGVCNGIAKVEHYILNLAGIESEMVSSGKHAFLRIKDIELPLANGDIIKGDTILDPTWNLTSHRYKAKPSNFCINYEQARQNDIDGKGNDSCAHKNDKELKNVTSGLDIESLKKLFASVGLAKKDGTFPSKDFMDKSNEIHKLYADDPSKDMKEQFLYLEHICPEFATCQNSTISYLDEVVLDNENLNIDKYHVSRVYKKDDKNKRPVLYVYITSKELGDKFYYADKEKGKFIELSPKEFTQNFDCYEADLKLTNRS